MQFEELEARFGKQNKADWHQHKNGGAWVYKSAVVNDDVFIGDKCVVWGGTILGGTIWGGTIKGGTIKGGTIWGGTIEGGTIKGGTIKGGTIWGGTIWGGTIEGGTIEGGDWKTSVLFLMDSRGHGATNSKPGHLRIGCELHTFAEWKKRFKAIARMHGLSKEELVEYKAIVDLFCKLGK